MGNFDLGVCDPNALSFEIRKTGIAAAAITAVLSQIQAEIAVLPC